MRNMSMRKFVTVLEHFSCQSHRADLLKSPYLITLGDMSTPFKGGRHIVLLRLASASALALALALASGLTQRHPLLDFFLGAPKCDPCYIEIIFHW